MRFAALPSLNKSLLVRFIVSNVTALTTSNGTAYNTVALFVAKFLQDIPGPIAWKALQIMKITILDITTSMEKRMET